MTQSMPQCTLIYLSYYKFKKIEKSLYKIHLQKNLIAVILNKKEQPKASIINFKY